MASRLRDAWKRVGSYFATPLVLEQVADRKREHWRLWRVREPLTFILAPQEPREARELHFSVTPGFVTDCATIPAFLQPLLPSMDRCAAAAVLHDYLCARLAIDAPHYNALTREVADSVFYWAARAQGVRPLAAWLMWAGVRVGALLGVRTKMTDENRRLKGMIQ